ncbi:MAG: MMPL family transporter [Deltaproteobacteria bacterium]|nr:MMPL family transporter [Deltaproteobacteria bacterium]
MNATATYWRRLTITLASMALLFVVGWSRLGIEADVVGLLPQNDPVVADALTVFSNHPIQDQLVIDIAINVEDTALLVDCGQRAEVYLRQSRLFRKVGLQAFQSLLPDLTYHVWQHLPLLFSEEMLQHEVAPLIERQAVRKKMAAVQTSLYDLSGIGQAAFIARDPLGMREIVMSRLADLAPVRSARIYEGQVISGDGRHVMVVAETAASSTDTGVGRQIAALLDTLAATLEKAHAESNATITLTPLGAYRFALDNEQIAKKDVRNAVLLATMGILLLLVISFPRPYLGVLSLLPALAGTTAAFCAYSLFYKTISLMVLGFGGAIISISVDHGIAYLLFLDRPRRTFGKDASREVRAVGLVAALTTIGAFSALTFSGFPILEQLGRFTAMGVGFSFLFVHTVFPRIFPEMPAARTRRMPLKGVVDALSNTGRKGLVAALALALIMLFFAKPDFNISLEDMNTVSVETKKAEKMISRVWGAGMDRVYLMTEGKTLGELQTKDDRLAAMVTRELYSEVLSSGFAASMVFPGEVRQRENFDAWKRFWHVQRVSFLKQAFRDGANDLGFASDAFEPFFEMLTLKTFEEASSGAPATVPEKYFDLVGIRHTPGGQSWTQISSVTTGAEYRAETFLKRYAGIAKIYDPVLFSQRLGGLLFTTFTKMLIIIGLSVVGLLLFYFVDVKLTLISLLPVVFALICTLGTLKLTGQALDIPALMLAIVVIGMGIDYALFFVRSYQRYGEAAHPYFGLIRMMVFLAGASTLIGFGVLSTAHHTLLKSAGTTLFFGIGYALVGTFFILPPLLEHRMRHGAKAGDNKGGVRKRVLARYRLLEAYPRLFARFKMRLDPMFYELPGILDACKGPRIILDIGCGYGVQACWLLERFPQAEVVGIDPDADRIRVAAAAAGKRAFMHVAGAPEIPELEEPADLVIMLDIVHYLDDGALQLTLQRLFARLRPGGRLIFRGTVPPEGRAPLRYRIEELRLRINRTPSFYRTVDALEGLMRNAGFTVEDAGVSGGEGELRWLVAVKGGRHAGA